MPKRSMSAKEELGLNANESVGSLSPFAAVGELRNLGDEAVRVIRAELSKAESDSLDQVEEVFQSSLVKMYDSIARRGLSDVGSLQSFFLDVSRNEARKYARQALRKQPLLAALRSEVQLPQVPLEDERSLMLKALLVLPRRFQRIISLSLIENKNDEEVRSILKISPAAFSTTKSRALKALRVALGSVLTNAAPRKISKKKTIRIESNRNARLRAVVESNPSFGAEISTLELLDDAGLWNAAQTRMPESDSDRMEKLHRKHRMTGLSEAESQELARLEQQYGRVILVRSHSASLLEQRGHDIRRLTSSQEGRRLAPGG